MRIGILTLPLHTNYGGILQAYALQTVLERMGHDVCLIEKKKTTVKIAFVESPFVIRKENYKKLDWASVPNILRKENEP